MAAYLYTLEFGIFITKYFPIPSTLVLGLPLIVLFGKFRPPYLYVKESVIIFVASFLYFVVAQEDVKSFVVVLMVSLFSAGYFQFVVGDSRRKFNVSVLIFFGFLVLSSVIMYLDHFNPDKIDVIRYHLNGADEIVQTPSGITSKIFTFGYQIAALTVFLFLYAYRSSRREILVPLALAFSAIAIYYGMQRSVLVDFAITVGLFFLAYLPFSRILVVAGVAGVMLLAVNTMDIASENHGDNIFSKNERNQEDGEHRSNLVIENLKIYSSYPYGLLFYNKKWEEVIRGNPAYPEGITSHNAYLMFITYLGPFIGITLLIALFYRIGKVFRFCLDKSNARDHPMLVCLCFSFLSASINSCFHNAWLLDMADGVMLFLYFSIIHYYEKFAKPIADENKILAALR